jgi:hypothetical protein
VRALLRPEVTVVAALSIPFRLFGVGPLAFESKSPTFLVEPQMLDSLGRSTLVRATKCAYVPLAIHKEEVFESVSDLVGCDYICCITTDTRLTARAAKVEIGPLIRQSGEAGSALWAKVVDRARVWEVYVTVRAMVSGIQRGSRG